VQDEKASVVGLVDVIDPSIPPSHYFEYGSDEDTTYVPRFYTDESSGSVSILGANSMSGSVSILGANSMMGRDIFFDVDNNRVGFTESSCDYIRPVC
jgi:hypothetical protein